MTPTNPADLPFAAPARPTARNTLSNLPAAGPAVPAELTVTFPAGGGAVVHGTPFGDITYSADGTEARSVQKSSNGLTGEDDDGTDRQI